MFCPFLFYADFFHKEAGLLIQTLLSYAQVLNHNDRL